jgi:very-short-patch-repair endonuclease
MRGNVDAKLCVRVGIKIKTNMINETHHYYNKKLQAFANENRKQMTKAEACLWKYALKAKMTGYTFNRERPVLNYIADFMCKELKLIIEVDGSIHHLPEVHQNDVVRQQALENAGFTVIRFTNDEVLTQIEGVKRKIEEMIQELNKLLTIK